MGRQKDIRRFPRKVPVVANTMAYVNLRRRRASRLLIIDPRNRVLLLQYQDEQGRYWATPGGGAEHGESFDDAAMREAREELGLTGLYMQSLWRQVNEFESKGIRYFQVERFFLVRVSETDVIVANGLEEAHAVEGILAVRWYSGPQISDQAIR